MAGEGSSAMLLARLQARGNTTFQDAYSQKLASGSASGFTDIVRWGETGRMRVILAQSTLPSAPANLYLNSEATVTVAGGCKLIVRLPANAPGNVKIGVKTITQNFLIDTGNLGSTTYTLTPGNEFVDDNGSISTRALTTSTMQRHTIANQTLYSTIPPFMLSKDGITFFGNNGASSTVLLYSTNYDTNPGSATWTTIKDFSALAGGTYVPYALVETPDGEVLVWLVSPGFGSVLYKSTGWAANKTTATWTLVQTLVGGGANPEYSGHFFAHGANGVVVFAESGSQTAGGIGNDSTDNTTKGVRVYASASSGAVSSWSTIFNIRDFATTQGFQYPAGVHIHGVVYDTYDDRIYICYGDNTGDAKNIAGIGFAQIVYADNVYATLLAAGTLTWTKLPEFTTWQTQASGDLPYTTQIIVGAFDDKVLMFTCDASNPLSPFVVRRAGYRTLGDARVANYARGLTGKINKVGNRFFLPGVTAFSQPAGSYDTPIMVGKDSYLWDQILLQQTLSVTDTVGIKNVIGPTANGKMIVIYGAAAASMTGGNVMVGDLQYA